ARPCDPRYPRKQNQHVVLLQRAAHRTPHRNDGALGETLPEPLRETARQQCRSASFIQIVNVKEDALRASTITKMEVEPLLISIAQTCQLSGLCPAVVYDLIGGGRLEAVKSDGRTLVRMSSIKRYVDSLPEAKVAPPRERKPQHLRQRVA